MARNVLAAILAACVLLIPLLSLCGCNSLGFKKSPEVKWRFSTEDRIVSTPALGEDGTIYFTTTRLLYALAPDGKMKWRYFPGAELKTSPVVGPDGTIYIVDVSCLLHALNSDGTKRWVVEVGHFLPASPLSGSSCWTPSTPALSHSGLLLVGSAAGLTYALDAGSGATKNQIARMSAPGSPEISEEGIAIEGGGALQRFDAAGNIYWTVRLFRGTSTLSFRTPAITEDGRIVVAGWDDKLHVYDFEGQPKWEFAGAWRADPVIAADGTIFVGDTDGIVALGANGVQLWRSRLTWAGSPALAEDGTIYAPGQDMGARKDGSNLFGLYALSPRGEMKWKLNVDGLIQNGPTIAPDGTVYFGTNASLTPGTKDHLGILYAIGEKNGGLMRGGWPKSYGSATNDGRPAVAP